MYPFRPFALQLGALIHRVSPRWFWASTLTGGLILLIIGGIGVSAVLVGRASGRPLGRTAGAGAAGDAAERATRGHDRLLLARPGGAGHPSAV